LRHAVLYGEYEISFDSKHRALLPVELRRAIDPKRDGEALFLVVGINRVPWLYPEKYYQELVTRDPADITPGDESLAFDQMMFAMAHRLQPDPGGRVLIPEKILKRVGIEKQATLIGVNDHMELWDTKAWERRREELMSRSSEIALKAKLARVQQARLQERDASRDERNT